MGFTKRELIQFLDGLVELASGENKAKAVLAKEMYSGFFYLSHQAKPYLSGIADNSIYVFDITKEKLYDKSRR